MSRTCRPSGRGMTASERFGPRCRRLTLEQITDPRLQVQPKFCLRTGARQPSHRFFLVSMVQMNPHTGSARVGSNGRPCPKVEIRVATAAIGSTRSTHHAGVACSDMVRVMCAPWRIGGKPRKRGWRRPRYLAALLDIQLNFRNSRMACSMKSSANCFGVMPQAAASAAIAL